MSFVSVLEHYPAAMPTRLSAGETHKSPRQMTGGDVKFSELLKNVATDKTAAEALSGDDRLGLIQEDLRRHMVMNMFNYMDIKAITLDSHERWQSLDNFPVTRESSNNRQASILSDAASCPDNIDEIIHRAARHFEVEPSLIRSVIKVESNYRPDVVSRGGSRGLMQIHPSLAKGIAKEAGVHYRGLKDLYDPRKNIRLGTHYISKLMDLFNDIPTAIFAYSVGHHKAKRLLSADKSPRTPYTKRVIAEYRKNTKKMVSL